MCENLLKDGPDIVAMVMAVEEKFNITLPDEDAEKIRNMGQLHDYVFDRVARGQEQICFTSAAFYRLRRALGEVCGVPREQVRPQARLDDLIPLNDRARCWRELQARLGKLPCLRRPSWLVKRIEVASFIPFILLELCALIPGVLLKDTPVGVFFLTLTIIPGPFVGILAMFLVCREACRRTEHYAIHFSPSCATIRDLVYALVIRHPSPSMVSDTERANDKEIWGAVCAIVGGQLDRPLESFTRRSTFV